MRLGRLINETLILIPEQILWHERIGTIRQEVAVDIIILQRAQMGSTREMCEETIFKRSTWIVQSFCLKVKE